MAAINEYKKKEEVYMARVAELDTMTAARDEQKKHHDDLRFCPTEDFFLGGGGRGSWFINFISNFVRIHTKMAWIPNTGIN